MWTILRSRANDPGRSAIPHGPKIRCPASPPRPFLSEAGRSAFADARRHHKTVTFKPGWFGTEEIVTGDVLPSHERHQRVTLETTIAAPVEEVWRTWTTPDDIKR